MVIAVLAGGWLEALRLFEDASRVSVEVTLSWSCDVLSSCHGRGGKQRLVKCVCSIFIKVKGYMYLYVIYCDFLCNGGRNHMSQFHSGDFMRLHCKHLQKLVFAEIRYVYVVYLKGLCRDTGRCQRYLCGA